MNMATNIKNLPILVALIISIGTVCATANVVADTQDLGGTSDAHGKAEPTTTKAERLVHPTGKPPFPYKDLGANWQYANDKDKLPLIRAAFKSERLRKHYFKPEDNPVCKTFPNDFMKGKFQVINPEFEALSDDDPRLGKAIPYNAPSDVWQKSDNQGPLYWNRCDEAPREESTAVDDNAVYGGLYQLGEPPYRIYRIKGKDGTKMDIALVREGNGLKPPKWKIDGYGQDYYLVNLAGCEVLGVGQVFSPVIQDNRKHDAVSLLIRYQGQPLVLAYLNWAKTGEPNSVEVMLENLYSDPDHFELCDWAFPNTFK